MKKLLLTLLLSFASRLAFASFPAGTFPDPEMICPIDGEKFVVRNSPGMGISMGSMLDLQPCGGDYSGNWPVPICPTSRFAMYRTFSEQESKLLREYVKTSEFIQLSQAGNIDDQIVATMRYLHEDPDKIAFKLLSGSWHRSEPSYSEYAKEALVAYEGILKNPPVDEKLWRTQQLVAGELERRLSLYSDARRRFLALRESGKFNDAESTEWIALELRLIEEKDNLTSSTNADCRAEHHRRITLPMLTCKNRKNPDSKAARIVNFCSCRPKYPKDSIFAEETGEIAIKFTVDSNNQLIDEQIVHSTGFKSLDNAAKSGLAQCQFQAPLKRGKADQGSFFEKFTWSYDVVPGTGDIQPDFEMQ